MKKTEVVKSLLATVAAGISIYVLKKREEKIFKKEYNALQEKHLAEIQEITKNYEAEEQ